jgi:outer membrane lipoprotein-sorting protein
MSKRRTYTWMAATAWIALAGTARAATDDAAALLAKADGFRAGFDSFVTRVRITNSEGERQEVEDFEVSIKGDNSFVRFLSSRGKGQALLMRGDDMWFLLPSVARPVRITPIQRLLGNVSNGDIARQRYAVDYDATRSADETVDGEVCAVLELRARRKGATYARIRYSVRPADGRPVRAEFFLTSGKATKTATFEGLREIAGRPILSRLVIHDVLKTDARSTVEILDIVPRALPDKMFNPVRSEGH